MQDLSTGELRPLAPKFFEHIPPSAEALQAAKDDAQPDRTKHGPVFFVGEELEIKGGRFRVHAMAGTRMYLDSLPAKP